MSFASPLATSITHTLKSVSVYRIFFPSGDQEGV